MNGLTSLSLNGGACWASGGGFECNGSAFSPKIWC
jgi:hypothetical protein